MADGQRQRLAPEARRELLLDAAEEIFAANGYTQSGLAEIADRAGVSKTLLYHYYPDGRPELYRAVMARLVEGGLVAIGEAARAPLAPAKRVGRVIDALLSFFEDQPFAYRLIISEPWGSGDPSVISQAIWVRTRLASELAGILASANQSAERTTIGAVAAVGALLQICELRMSDQLDGEQARLTAGAFVRGGLAGLDLL